MPDSGSHENTIASLATRLRHHRKVQGIAATLLPYEANGRVAVEAFQNHLKATHRAGLLNAVNMDTGYVNFLNESEKRDVLGWTREALGKNVPFVAGAYVEGQDGDLIHLYRHELDIITSLGAIPIIFPTATAARKEIKRKGRDLSIDISGVSASARFRVESQVCRQRRDL